MLIRADGAALAAEAAVQESLVYESAALGTRERPAAARKNIGGYTERSKSE